jgi:hypothetical protein
LNSFVGALNGSTRRTNLERTNLEHVAIER